MFNNNCGTGIVPVMDMNGNNNNNGWMDGGMWAWWIIIFAMFGWGNGGFGWGNGGNGGGAQASYFTDAAVQRGFDNQSIMNKLNGIEQGICSSSYDQLSQTNGIQNTVQQTGWNLQQTMQNNAVAAMQQQFSLQQLISDCCCENRVGQMNIVNQMDRNNCATNNLMQQLSQQQMWANQQGFRDISDQIAAGFRQIEVSNLQQENARLQRELNRCDRDSALQGTANYIVNQVSPRSQPAYLTCNPNTGMTIPQAALDQWQTFRCSHPCCYPQQNQGCCPNGQGYQNF